MSDYDLAAQRLGAYFEKGVRNPADASKELLEYAYVPKRLIPHYDVVTGAGTIAAGAASVSIKADGADATITTSAGSKTLSDGETVGWAVDYPHELGAISYSTAGNLLVAKVTYE